jgi:phosphatidylserine/phosphatidylglycerophosphate/cardiolipin synthase-like enzyme
MIPAIQSLGETDLREIAAALHAGRLTPPFTAAALQRFCSSPNDRIVAMDMQSLADEGMKTAHLALLLESLAAAHSLRPELRDPVDLVWTGPEAPGIANRDTAVVVRELFANANECVLVAGYAIHQGREVFRALADRMTRLPELKVRLFLNVHRRHRDTTKDFELVREFAHTFKTAEWPGDRLPEVYYDPRSLEMDSSKRASMHAKCIVIDRKVAFVSSANFTEAAQVRNIEVGALIRSERFAVRLAEHFEELAARGLLRPIPALGAKAT